MKNQTLLILSIIFLIACAPDKSSKTEEKKPEQNAVVEVTDPTKGIGQVKNVNLHSPLEQDRIGRGQAIYEMKCSACHRLDATRVVGPGWKDPSGL